MKARLVARGDMQREFIDFGELYAPTVSVSSVRMLAALACEKGWYLAHFDVEQAYTRAEIEEKVHRYPLGGPWGIPTDRWTLWTPCDYPVQSAVALQGVYIEAYRVLRFIE